MNVCLGSKGLQLYQRTFFFPLHTHVDHFVIILDRSFLFLDKDINGNISELACVYVKTVLYFVCMFMSNQDEQ